jgi:uncharacterized membrane protein YfcA
MLRPLDCTAGAADPAMTPLEKVEHMFYNIRMEREVLILAGAIVGLFGWQSMPKWRQALRFAPLLALMLSAIGAFTQVNLPVFVPPLLLGIAVTIAALQLVRPGGGTRSRRYRKG